MEAPKEVQYDESAQGLRPRRASWRIKASLAVVVVLVLGGATAGAYYLGFREGFSQTKNIEIKGVAAGEKPEKVTADFSIFWQAWDELKSKHLNGKNFDDQELLYGAIRGLAGSFDDPNTVFFDPGESKKFIGDIQGSFGGIGAELGSKDHQIIIVTPLKNTPAERAGLKPRDAILQVDDTSTTGMTVDEAVRHIRGEPGEKVVLTIMREGWADQKKIEIIREVINVPTVDWSLKGNSVLYLQLYSFNANAEGLFYQAVLEGLLKGGRGMVLDLRNNPGGYLDEAVDLAGWFVERGTVVTKEHFADGSERVLTANGNQALKDFPVVVLINEGSASASEILAGALRVTRGVKLVGVKSFGKGTVQEVDDLKDGSTLKITIANWLLPDGTVIDKNGLEPDYEVKLSEEDAEAKRDPQLDKALQVLEAEIAAKGQK